MAKPEKVTAVALLTREFQDSGAAVLTEYRGLTVAQLKELRRALGGTTNYAVVKNTLTKIAARDAGVQGLDDLLVGPSAIAFVKGDVVEAARGLRDFSKAHPMLVIKGGVLDGKPLSADDIRTLADLEPREVLLAKLAGAMNASLSKAAALFQAPLSQAARVIEALREQRSTEAPEAPEAEVVADAVEAPAAEAADVAPIEAPESTEAVEATEAPAEAADEPATEA